MENPSTLPFELIGPGITAFFDDEFVSITDAISSNEMSLSKILGFENRFKYNIYLFIYASPENEAELVLDDFSGNSDGVPKFKVHVPVHNNSDDFAKEIARKHFRDILRTEKKAFSNNFNLLTIKQSSDGHIFHKIKSIPDTYDLRETIDLDKMILFNMNYHARNSSYTPDLTSLRSQLPELEKGNLLWHIHIKWMMIDLVFLYKSRAYELESNSDIRRHTISAIDSVMSLRYQLTKLHLKDHLPFDTSEYLQITSSIDSLKKQLDILQKNDRIKVKKGRKDLPSIQGMLAFLFDLLFRSLGLDSIIVSKSINHSILSNREFFRIFDKSKSLENITDSRALSSAKQRVKKLFIERDPRIQRLHIKILKSPLRKAYEQL